MVETASLFFALLAVGAQLAVAALVGLRGWASISPSAMRRWSAVRYQLAPSAVPIAWLVAAVSTAGSLYYSEVAHFVPCTLCWYQRIAMYPLAVLLVIAALRKDTEIWRYTLPLTLPGASIAIYHYQLQRFPGQGSVACDAQAPCTLTWVWELSYVSIPLMALSGFALITTLVLLARSPERDDPVP